jgi:hypothetical protein
MAASKHRFDLFGDRRALIFSTHGEDGLRAVVEVSLPENATKTSNDSVVLIELVRMMIAALDERERKRWEDPARQESATT